jgi:lipopolysaccharide biosynthesis glycosyltransferase
MYVVVLIFVLSLLNVLLLHSYCILKIDFQVVCLFVSVLWYAFVFLNTLQGLFIFLNFTCTQKVWSSLRKQLGLKGEVQTQWAKVTVNTATAATWM